MQNLLTFSSLCLVLSGCSPHGAMTTAQVIKDLNCDQQSNISYKRCDTNIEDEYKRAQEIKELNEKEAENEERLRKIEELKKQKAE